MGGKETDEEIRRLFSAQVERAEAGQLQSWLSSPRGALAVVILLDQFALNLYRNEARGYHCSELAIPLARRILRQGWEYTFTPAEKTFLFMPLEHSESLGDQKDCVARFRELAASSPAELKGAMQGSLDYAERHLKVVERFGRFPHRNAALGRKSSAEELAFLATKDAPF